MKAVYLAMYLFGFCIGVPMLALVVVAYAQQADFAVALRRGRGAGRGLEGHGGLLAPAPRLTLAHARRTVGG